MTIKYVYVAGPYTHNDPVENTRNAIDVGDELMEQGFIPYVPHLSLFWHLIHLHDVDCWYAFDCEWLRKCDALVRLPGMSKGADAEVVLAEELGIPVFYSLDQLRRAAFTIVDVPDSPDD